MRGTWRITSAVLTVLAFGGCGERAASDAAGETQTLRGEGSPVALTPQQVAAGAFPSVVLLSMTDENHQVLALGSGFVVAPNVVATNFHVIEGAFGGRAKRVGREETLPMLGVLATDPAHDLALLSVSSDASALPLARGVPAVGDPVYAVGNPQGFEGTFSPGIVSAVREVNEDRILQITAPISPGSSGGPVLNDLGQVIGVATATYTGGQALNFAVPAAAVAALLSEQAVQPQPFRGEVPSARRVSLLERLEGEPATAGVVGDRLEWNAEYVGNGGFTISLRNKLGVSVENIVALVIFYDKDGVPLEVAAIGSGLIPPGLARRVGGEVHSSVRRLTTRPRPGPAGEYGGLYLMQPYTRVEVRILNYDPVE